MMQSVHVRILVAKQQLANTQPNCTLEQPNCFLVGTVWTH